MYFIECSHILTFKKKQLAFKIAIWSQSHLNAIPSLSYKVGQQKKPIINGMAENMCVYIYIYNWASPGL